MEYLINIFSTEGFPPRWYCGSAWSSLLGWTHIVSDFLIFLSYTAIPIALIYLIKKRSDVPFTPIIWLFASFILFCGLSHLVEASIFWYPWYRLSGLIKTGTALISIITAIILIKKLPLVLNIQNILQKKEALEREIAIRDETEKFFEDFYENAPDMFASIGNDKNIINCNNKLVEITGYAKHEIVNKNVAELYHPDCMKELDAASEFYKKHSYIENAELEFKKKNGEKVAVILNVTPVKDKKGNILYTRAVWRDVNNLKKATKRIKEINTELLAQKQQYQAISHRLAAVLDSVADGIITINSQGIIESINAAAEDIFKWRVNEVIGRHIEIFRRFPYTDIEKANFYEYLSAIAGNGSYVKKEVECLRKDGSIFSGELSLNETMIANEIKFICSIRDISARKIIENKLQDAYEQIKNINFSLLAQNRQYEALSKRLNAVLNGTADAILTINAEGIIESYNYAAQRMYQYSPEEVIGKSTTILNPPERFDPSTMGITLKSLVTEINCNNEEICRKKDGTLFPIEYSLVEVLIDGEVKFIGSIRDISERKRIESELNSAYQEVLSQKHQLETLTNRLNAVLNSTADAIITMSKEGIIESFNHSAERIFLYSAEEVIGKSSILLSSSDSTNKTPEEMEATLRSLTTPDDIGREIIVR